MTQETLDKATDIKFELQEINTKIEQLTTIIKLHNGVILYSVGSYCRYVELPKEIMTKITELTREWFIERKDELTTQLEAL